LLAVSQIHAVPQIKRPRDEHGPSYLLEFLSPCSR
jgi:hypothetical protein